MSPAKTFLSCLGQYARRFWLVGLRRRACRSEDSGSWPHSRTPEQASDHLDRRTTSFSGAYRGQMAHTIGQPRVTMDLRRSQHPPEQSLATGDVPQIENVD